MKPASFPKTRSSLNSTYKQTTVETDIESSCGKVTPKRKKIYRKHKNLQKKTSSSKRNNKPIFHQRIYRFRIPIIRKTLRIYEYKESDLKWPKKFTKFLCPQEIDNDVQSDSQLIQEEIEKCKRNLFQQISKQTGKSLKWLNSQ